MKRRLFAITVGVMLMAACSASPADYRKETEKYLESDSLADEAGYRFSEAVCEQPSSENEGTQFSCSAVDNDGDEWEFIVEITGDREITVVDGKVTG
ncbi:MAG: hypothetical protein FJW18_07680 [Actinobacteria bacterium]|nr:hypothetical protein [Actinomycetota bacterium]